MGRLLLPVVSLFLLMSSVAGWAGNAPRVQVSIKPVHSIVAGIMEGIGKPHLIVDGQATPYGYKLSDEQLAALSDADMVIWTGAELEPFLAEPLAKLDGKVLSLELLNNRNLKVLPVRDNPNLRDPFLWLDTRNTLILVNELTNAIVELDPSNELLYRRNSARLLEKMGNLDREFEYGYRSVKAGRVYLYHDTLQYFEQAYGTRVVGTLSARPGEMPDATAFLEARADIYNEEAAVDCVLTEAGMPANNLNILITGSRVKVVELDSFGTRLEPGLGLYEAMMRNNFEAIKSCFSKGDEGVKLEAELATAIPENDDQVLPSQIRGKYILQDQNGKTVTDEDYLDSFQLITFGYTSCPDICPATLQVISGTIKRLGGQEALVQPIFISVDPQRDTVAVLNRYVGYFHPRIVGLTGPQPMIDRVVAQFKAKVEKEYLENSEDGAYIVNHTAGTYLLAPGAQFVKKFGYGTTSIEMAEGIKFYLDQL